jgi:retinol dehydrogenase-12
MDMADFASVSAFATAFEQKYERLDVLVCNAAIAVGVYEASKAYWESTYVSPVPRSFSQGSSRHSSIQVNHLSTALVSLLLLPLMNKTARTHNTHPRLVIVSSGVHYWTEVEPAVRATPSILETISSKAYCVDQYVPPALSQPSTDDACRVKMADRYNLSKLLNVLFTRALAAHLPPAGAIIVDTVDPGYCYSALRRHASGLQGAAFAVMDLLLGRKTHVGARTLVWAANAGRDDPALRDALKGAYTSSCEITEPSDFVLSPGGQEAEKRLWVCTSYFSDVP